MVRFINQSELTASEREACRALYKEGFPEDSDEYLEWFLNNKEYTVAMNDAATSALYLVPKKIRMYNAALDVKYIAAFSASKSVRGTGAAEEVMRAAIERESTGGTPFLFLSPFNYEYYRRYGFVNVDNVLTAVGKLQCERVKITDSAAGGEIIAEVRRKVGEGYDAAQIADYAEAVNRYNEEIVGGADFYALIESGGSVYGYELESRGRVYERFTENMRRTRKPHVQARIASIEAALKAVKFNASDYNVTLNVRDGDKITQVNLRGSGGAAEVNALGANDGTPSDIIDISELTALLIGGASTDKYGGIFPLCRLVMFDRY